jgi:hypothetical protein
VEVLKSQSVAASLRIAVLSRSTLSADQPSSLHRGLEPRGPVISTFVGASTDQAERPRLLSKSAFDISADRGPRRLHASHSHRGTRQSRILPTTNYWRRSTSRCLLYTYLRLDQSAGSSIIVYRTDVIRRSATFASSRASDPLTALLPASIDRDIQLYTPGLLLLLLLDTLASRVYCDILHLSFYIFAFQSTPEIPH